MNWTLSSNELNANGCAGVAPVPEPQSYAMLAGGLAVMGVLARRRKTRASNSNHAA